MQKYGSMLEALESIALFNGMRHADLDALARVSVPQTHPGNAVIVNEGDRADSLYLIFCGSVRIFVTGDDGRRVVLRTQGPGEFFGETALSDGVRSASAMTAFTARLL
jgi:CRP/FNR family cyclic AMP-dependent transcriptional regulator